MRYIDTYAEVKAQQKFSLRGVLRNLALDLISAIPASTSMNQPRIQFIYIHHSFKDEIPSLHILLDHLQQHFQIISHSEAVNRILEGRIDAPYLSISFDDGFFNNLLAAKVLADRNISACFYINPTMTGERNKEVIAEHCHKQLQFPFVQFLDWQEVEQLQKMGHEIGSHTLNHINIGASPSSEVADNIFKTHEILMSKCGSAEHFAWPYGRFWHFNDDARRSVFEAGFNSCASAERGCHIPTEQPVIKEQLCLRRDHALLDWKLSHIRYFLQKSANNAAASNNDFPYK